MNSSSIGNLNSVSVMALFNISLHLELLLPQESSSSFNIKEDLTWDQIKGLIYPNISRDWLEEVSVWYMPLMSYGAAEQWKSFFTGDNRKLNETSKEDWKNFCGYELWEDPIAILKGFNETQVVKCHLETNVVGAWNTTYWSDKQSKPSFGSAVISFTDNSKYLVEIRIWENQVKDWVVFSTERDISKDVMDKVMEHVSKLGFNPVETVSVDYKDCPEVDADYC